MDDGKGRHVEVGDTVQIWPGTVGKIVCSFEDEKFSQDFSQAEWGHLTEGALVKLSDGTLFHYNKPDEDFIIIQKGGNSKRFAR